MKHEIRTWSFEDGDDAPTMVDHDSYLSAWNTFVSGARMGMSVAFTVDGALVPVEEIWHRAGRPNRDVLDAVSSH
jgi:hypothetical protein